MLFFTHWLALDIRVYLLTTKLLSRMEINRRTALPCSVGYHLERGGMPLHDAVGINSKKGETTEYQGADVKYMS